MYSALVAGLAQVKSSATVGIRQSSNPPCTSARQHCETTFHDPVHVTFFCQTRQVRLSRAVFASRSVVPVPDMQDEPLSVPRPSIPVLASPSPDPKPVPADPSTPTPELPPLPVAPPRAASVVSPALPSGPPPALPLAPAAPPLEPPFAPHAKTNPQRKRPERRRCMRERCEEPARWCQGPPWIAEKYETALAASHDGHNR